MPSIDTTPAVSREVDLLAAAWNISPGEAVARLVDHYHITHTRRPADTAADGDVAVHRVYAGVRVEGVYHRTTGGLTVTTPPVQGRSYRSPSGARAAVVAALNPTIAPNGSGWTFWIITATGRTLASIRHHT